MRDLLGLSDDDDDDFTASVRPSSAKPAASKPAGKKSISHNNYF